MTPPCTCLPGSPDDQCPTHGHEAFIGEQELQRSQLIAQLHYAGVMTGFRLALIAPWEAIPELQQMRRECRVEL